MDYGGQHSSTYEGRNDHSSYSSCTASIQLMYGNVQLFNGDGQPGLHVMGHPVDDFGLVGSGHRSVCQTRIWPGLEF